MGRYRLLAGLLAVAVILVVALPASAIRYGDVDGNNHPFVGLMVAFNGDGAPLWRCSGTMIAPRVFLTAGHCTESPAASAQLFFDADVGDAILAGDYPFNGDAAGTVYTHPDYDPGFFVSHDLGVVVLDAPYDPGTYGELPTLDQLDVYDKARRDDVYFRAVGYGLQRILAQVNPNGPAQLEYDFVRRVAYPRLVQINRGIGGVNGGIVKDFAILLSINANTGGTCFGDSGGPIFVDGSNVVGAVTSYGINFNCAGVGGAYRVDRADDLEWLAEEFGDLLE